MIDLLSRNVFRERLFARDNNRCVIGGEGAADAHPSSPAPSTSWPGRMIGRCEITLASLLPSNPVVQQCPRSYLSWPHHNPPLVPPADRHDDILDLQEFADSLELLEWWQLSRKTMEEWVKTFDKNTNGQLERAIFPGTPGLPGRGDRREELTPRWNHAQHRSLAVI